MKEEGDEVVYGLPAEDKKKTIKLKLEAIDQFWLADWLPSIYQSVPFRGFYNKLLYQIITLDSSEDRNSFERQIDSSVQFKRYSSNF